MKRSPLRRVSRKQGERLAVYRVLKGHYFEEHPACEMPRCKKWAEDIHHKAGRGINTNNVEFFMAVCRTCHRKIHDQPVWAAEKGYLL